MACLGIVFAGISAVGELAQFDIGGLISSCIGLSIHGMFYHGIVKRKSALILAFFILATIETVAMAALVGLGFISLLFVDEDSVSDSFRAH